MHSDTSKFIGIEELYAICSESYSGITRIKQTSNVAKVGHCGTAMSNGYFSISYKGNHIYVHRVVFFLTHGYLPELIDHIDGNKHNNNPSNLREASVRQNASNKELHRKGKEPCIRFKKNRYEVEIRINNKKKYIGRYKTMEEAIIARDKSLTRETF